MTPEVDELRDEFKTHYETLNAVERSSVNTVVSHLMGISECQRVMEKKTK